MIQEINCEALRMRRGTLFVAKFLPSDKLSYRDWLLLTTNQITRVEKNDLTITLLPYLILKRTGFIK